MPHSPRLSVTVPVTVTGGHFGAGVGAGAGTGTGTGTGAGAGAGTSDVLQQRAVDVHPLQHVRRGHLGAAYV